MAKEKEDDPEKPTNKKDCGTYGEAIELALKWLAKHHVQLEEAYEARRGGFGMRSADRSGGYRIEFSIDHGNHINVWCHYEKGPHYLFPGNEQVVRTLWRQLFFWDPNLKRRSDEDSEI